MNTKHKDTSYQLCLGLSVPHWEVVNYTTVFCFIIGEVDAEAGKLFFVECSTHLGEGLGGSKLFTL